MNNVAIYRARICGLIFLYETIVLIVKTNSILFVYVNLMWTVTALVEKMFQYDDTIAMLKQRTKNADSFHNAIGPSKINLFDERQNLKYSFYSFFDRTIVWPLSCHWDSKP